MSEEELERMLTQLKGIDLDWAQQARKDILALVAEVRRLKEALAEAGKVADLWKRQREADNSRWQQRWQRQVDFTNTWHGRYEVLRHENNRLRRKVQAEARRSSG